MFTNFPESRQDRLDSLVVNVESVGTVLNRPMQQLHPRFQLQMSVGFVHVTEGGVRCEIHRSAPGMIQGRSN